jgi:hypothetical protein
MNSSTFWPSYIEAGEWLGLAERIFLEGMSHRVSGNGVYSKIGYFGGKVMINIDKLWVYWDIDITGMLVGYRWI